MMTSIPAVAEVRDPAKVYIVWGWDDVQTLRPTWSQAECQQALDQIARTLVQYGVESGWDVLRLLVAEL